MTLTYSLDQEDFLTLQLFTASLSDRVKRQRNKSLVFWSIAFLCLAWLCYQNEDRFLTYYFLGFAILFVFFYPIYSKWFYKRHYRRYVNEPYRNRFGKVASVTIDNEQIHAIDETEESKILISELEKIYEIAEYFFLKLKSGMTLIIPKLKIDNLDLLTEELKTIADKQHIGFVAVNNWKWK